MSDPPRPRITLSWTAVFCARHSEPFRAEWPKGAGLAQLGIFNAATRDERITEACGIGPDGKADGMQLNRVLAEFGPLCCFLGDVVTGEVTALALNGLVWGHE